jgi:hypothetical protein
VLSSSSVRADVADFRDLAIESSEDENRATVRNDRPQATTRFDVDQVQRRTADTSSAADAICRHADNDDALSLLTARVERRALQFADLFAATAL